MIRNIVFDMGKVLLDYDPLAVCRKFTDKKEDVERIGRELFFAEEWILLDRGVITEAEALKRVQSRLPEERLKKLAEDSLAHWHEYNLRPMKGMEELIRSLKEKGYGIYLCSNASLRLRVYEQEIPGSRYFDGTIVSAEERLLKPDPAIYRRLFEKYHLSPGECFFIDDRPENIEGARSCGMDGYCFSDGDAEKLRSFLEKYLRRNGQKPVFLCK